MAQNEIYREIWLTENRRVEPISVSENSKIPIKLKVMDTTISGSTARAYAYNGRTGAYTTNVTNPTVASNVVTLIPDSGLFLAGSDRLQIQFPTSGGNYITREFDVVCAPDYSNGGKTPKAEDVKGLTERAEAAAKTASDVLASIPEDYSQLSESIDDIKEDFTQAVGGMIEDSRVQIHIKSTYHKNTDTGIPVTAGKTYYIRKMLQSPYWYNVYVPGDESTICRLKGNVNFVPLTPTISGYLRFYFQDNATESMDFEIVAESDFLRRNAMDAIRAASETNNIMSAYTKMIVSDDMATAEFGNNYNNLLDNKVYTIGYASSTSINAPYSRFLGNVMTYAYSGGYINGKVQIAVSSTGRMLHRICWGPSGLWKDWVEVAKKEEDPKIFYVGGNSQNQSLTELFMSLKNDTTEKIIYINPGVYDIFAEYRAAGVATPPDDVSSSDYLTRCVFLPPNTRLIGLGNVTLEWLPEKATTTYGEARTWSPLNVRYACHVENITIHCHNGRYCIHDDSHNAEEDQGVTHYYKDVRCIYDYVDDGYGFNNAIGFGFSQKNKIIFDRCTFEMTGDDRSSAFYGHSASSSSGALNIDDSPEIIIKDCIILGGTDGNSVRLQSLNDELLRIRTVFSGTYIEGGMYLTLYASSDKHAFDVVLLKSGNPAQKIDRNAQNPYPIRVYN